ncbi:MAG: serine hydrolase [Rhizobiaceae bacterium]|nr:serine hydrolase [Rhizobiaceae bacterium]
MHTTVDGEPTDQFMRRHLAGDFLLWSPNIQAEGFLNWDRIWASRTIRRGTPKPLPVAARQLDISFQRDGQTYTVDDVMRLEFVSGLLIVKDGEINLERYAMGLNPERCWQSSSMVKSLAAILIGAAIQDGAIRSVDQPITDYMPEFKDTSYEGVTIRDLLHMASGVEWVENTDDLKTDVAEHYIKVIAARKKDYILNYLRTRPRANPRGTQFYYNTGDTFILSHILSRATGKTVADYCSEKLWKPMGFEQDGFFILDSDDGHEVVGSCCGASLRDYARWGLFMLADGVIDGKRIVPEGWVKDCTSPTAPNFAFDFGGERGIAGGADSAYQGYGYLWWVRPGGDYQALGSYGQWIYVSPANNTVAVILGAVPRHVYMTREEVALHANSSHCGSDLRLDFIKAAMSALS